ncbi:hypothetical protein WCD58_29770 [Actinomycetospora sp. OC33-EN07]|uniref:Uncharacterized protein n=1 Tax=Actinomycetospora flava TaxID=3129232 RepID=A0ABU8MFD4_9PSEU
MAEHQPGEPQVGAGVGEAVASGVGVEEGRRNAGGVRCSARDVQGAVVEVDTGDPARGPDSAGHLDGGLSFAASDIEAGGAPA